MAKRENSSGSIVRRKWANGTKYIAYAPAKYEMVNGKRKAIRPKIGSYDRKSDASAALAEYLKHPSSKYNYTLRMVYEDWKKIAFADIQGQTQTNYTTCWDKISSCPDPAIADKEVREIRTAEMRSVLDYYLSEHTIVSEAGQTKTVKPLSKSYITKIKALLTQLFNYALENNIVDRNYASLVKLPKMQDSKARAFSDLEFQTLEKNYHKVAGGEACYVLCYTGWRVSEFCNLTKFSYDPVQKVLRGGMKTEAGTNRVVPVHPKILPIIERWYQASTGPLFPRPDGTPYDKDSFKRKIWEPCMAALGLSQELTPHSARHTFGTKLSAAGVPQEDIQRLMGHKDFSVTANTYINQDISTLKGSIGKVV